MVSYSRADHEGMDVKRKRSDLCHNVYFASICFSLDEV